MLAEYGASRGSLREALRLLEVQGLVSIRRGAGGGPSVCTVDPANLGRMATLYYQMAGGTYRELLEAWVEAQTLLARRAARNPDAEARVAAMTPYLMDGNGVRHAHEDLESFMRDHMSFHADVAALGRNRVLELSLQAMGQIVSHHVAVADDPRALGRDLGDDHRRIAVAIVAGDAEQAAALMAEHVDGIAAGRRRTPGRPPGRSHRVAMTSSTRLSTAHEATWCGTHVDRTTDRRTMRCGHGHEHRPVDVQHLRLRADSIGRRR